MTGATSHRDGQPIRADSQPIADASAENSPVVILSYANSGADSIQKLLSAGTNLACTQGTGIIPLCLAAAEAWQRVDGYPVKRMSRLAAISTRRLIAAQMAVLLAGTGKARWCELAIASPSAADAFFQIFPGTAFVCVHRSCIDVIRASVHKFPWGLQGSWSITHALAYPGNSVAAHAAHWATSTELLLQFESANPNAAYRVRYEDATADSDWALTAIRESLRLQRNEQDSDGHSQAQCRFSAASGQVEPHCEVPIEMIPAGLRQRIARLHAELGYPTHELLLTSTQETA
jgi:hypothetical protein